MAKASMKAREERRRKTVLRYAAKRAELKEIIRSPLLSRRERCSADKTPKTA
jgi:small subunit ribosomal protein S14